MNRTFHICTIVNDREQYRGMREAFAEAGFSDEMCRFSEFDNTGENRFEPYRLIDQLISDTPQRYLILCHQDVRPNLGHSAAFLVSVLDALNKSNPGWLVAGNAGVDCYGNSILHLDDPHGRFRATDLPRRVLSLDENFLVIRPRSGLGTSPELNGFHFYGTDLALNASVQGGGAFVIGFLLTHLSAGNIASAGYLDTKDRFEKVWRGRLDVGLVRTPTGAEFRISRRPLIERILRRRRIGKVLWKLGVSIIPRKPGATKQHPTWKPAVCGH
jgi:hypothetical protein